MYRQTPLPARPSIPLAFYAMLAAVGSIRICLQLRMGPEAACVPALGLACAAAALCLPRLAGRRAPVRAAVVLAVASVGLASGSICADRVASCADSLASSAVSSWRFEIEADPAPSGGTWRVRARALREGCAEASVWLSAPEELGRGSVVGGVGRFKPNGDDEWGSVSFSQGVCGSVSLVRVKEADGPSGAVGALLGFRSSLVQSLCPRGEETAAGAVLAGLVCGSTTGLKVLGLDDAFAACGASHLIAVSGSHLGVVSAMVSALLARSRLGKAGKLLALSCATGMLVLLCGAAPSAVRSWVMALVAGGGAMLGRRGHSLSSVSLVALGMALAEPHVCGQVGFLLSVACVCGIGLFAGYARHVVIVLLGRPVAARWVPGRAARAATFCKGFVWDCLALGVVCQAASLPVAVPAFGKVSVVGLAAQVPLSALFGPALALGIASAALGSLPVVGSLARSLAFMSADALARLVGLFSSMPLCCVSVEASEPVLWAFAVAASAGLLVAWPKVTRRSCLAAASCALAVVAAWAVRWRWFSPARICVMDVGQADSVLVADGSSTLLVDAGVDEAVASALFRNHALHLDAILLTHLDEDHVGGLDELVGSVDVGCVYVAEGVADAMDAELADCVRRLCGAGPVEVSYGDVIEVGRYRARVVWPRAPVDGGENADSVVLDVAFSDGSRSITALLTGDAENDEVSAVVKHGDARDVDFLKVGHHGSAASVDPALADVLLPEVSVASAGKNNRYGHPRQECVDVLESCGSLFLCTKDVGDVTVEPGEQRPRVTCSGEGMPCE